MTQRLLRAALATLLSVAAACGGGSDPIDPSTVPATLEKSTVPATNAATGSAAGIFAVRVLSSTGSPIAGATVTFEVTGSATVSPTSATTDAAGQAQTAVTAGATAGQVTIVAKVTGTALSASAGVTVVAVSASSCGGLTVARTLAVGEVTSFQGVSAACLTGTAAGSEYALVAYNRDTAVTVTTTLQASGLGAAPSSNLVASSSRLNTIGGTAPSASLVPDYDFHRRMLASSERNVFRFPGARRWMASRGGRSAAMGTSATTTTTATSTSGGLAPSAAPAYNVIPANPTVGTLLNMNVNGDDGCENPTMHGVRIVAVGTKTVILADTLNPSGGFTTADYQRYAAQFDTLVFPMDVQTFGAPTDIDGNGRIGVLFTRAVNELTPANSSFYVGGFFYDRDLFPKGATADFGPGCVGSNEGEMFYMLAPDPNGVVNGNVRPTSLVDELTVGTLAHEFQHLINASRRIYVNQGAVDYEISWLNEGLSHIAEELLYYRETGKRPRLNLTDADIRVASNPDYILWKRDQSQNFGRFSNYLSNPAANTPTSLTDLLETRGATWSYLRYAADRVYATDGDVWFRLANSVKRSYETLTPVFGNDQPGMMRDWATANYTDDLGVTSDPRFQHASWNFHDIYTKTFVAGTYPLRVTGLTTGASVSVSVRRTSAGYYRLSVPAGGEGLIRLSSTGTAPSSSFEFVVVRTK